MKIIFFLSIWMIACGPPQDGDTSQVSSQSQDLTVNINDPNCELTESADCKNFIIHLFCNNVLAGARAATCDDCPDSCVTLKG